MADQKASARGGPSQPSGPAGKNPSTAGKEKTQLHSHTPENRSGSINPSSPNDAITAPSTQSLEEGDTGNNPL